MSSALQIEMLSPDGGKVLVGRDKAASLLAIGWRTADGSDAGADAREARSLRELAELRARTGAGVEAREARGRLEFGELLGRTGGSDELERMLHAERESDARRDRKSLDRPTGTGIAGVLRGVGGPAADAGAVVGANIARAIQDEEVSPLTGKRYSPITGEEVVEGESAGVEQMRALRAFEEANPTASMAGEIAGVAGSLFGPALAARIGAGIVGRAGAEAAGAAATRAAGAGADLVGGIRAAESARAPVEAAARGTLGVRALERFGSAGQATLPGLYARAARPIQAGAESVVGRALARTPLAGAPERVLARTVGMGLGSAVETAFYGAGHAVHESMLGKPQEAGQSVAANIGMSALISGGIGGALGGGLGLVGSGVAETLAHAATKRDGLVGALRRWFVRHLSERTGRPEGDFEHLFGQKDRLLRGETAMDLGRDLYRPAGEKPGAFDFAEPAPAATVVPKPGAAPKKGQPLTTAAGATVAPVRAADLTGEVSAALDDTYKAAEAVADRLYAIRPLDIVATLPDAPVTTAQQAARDGVLAEWQKIYDTMKADPMKFHAGYRNALFKAMKRFEKKTAAAKTQRELFAAMDDTRQVFGTKIPWDVEPPAAQRATVGIVKGAYGHIKRALTDAQAWGAEAAEQAERNLALHGYLTKRTNVRPSYFRTEIGPRGKQWISDPKKTHARLAGFGTPEEAVHKRQLAEWLDEVDNLITVTAKADARAFAALGMPPQMDVASARAAAGAGRAVRTRAGEVAAGAKAYDAEYAAQRAAHAADKTRYVRDLEDARTADAAARAGWDVRKDAARAAHDVRAEAWQASKETAAEQMRQYGRAMRGDAPVGWWDIMGVGGIFWRPALAPFYAAYRSWHALHSPEAVAKTLAHLERGAAATSRRIDSGARALAAGTVPGAVRADAAAGLARVYDFPTPKAVKNYERTMEDVRALAASPEALSQRTQEAVAQIEPAAPDTSSALQQALVRYVAFLSAKVYRPDRAGAFGPEWALSGADISDFNLYATALDSPEDLPRQAAAGTLSPLAVEAVEYVYPDLMAMIRQRVVERMAAEQQRRGEPLPYRSRLGLSMLLGYDIDGTLTPEAIAASQAVYGAARLPAQAASGAGRGRPAQTARMTLGSRMRTDTQRISEKTASAGGGR